MFTKVLNDAKARRAIEQKPLVDVLKKAMENAEDIRFEARRNISCKIDCESFSTEEKKLLLKFLKTHYCDAGLMITRYEVSGDEDSDAEDTPYLDKQTYKHSPEIINVIYLIELSSEQLAERLDKDFITVEMTTATISGSSQIQHK